MVNENNHLLTAAARSGDLETLNALIASGQAVDNRDEKGYTPFIIACYNRQPKAAKVLLEIGRAHV